MSVNWDRTPWNAPPGELASDHFMYDEDPRDEEGEEDEEQLCLNPDCTHPYCPEHEDQDLWESPVLCTPIDR